MRRLQFLIMDFPVQSIYRGFDRSAPLDRLIADEAAKLGKFFDGIVGCRVLIELTHPGQHSGKAFRVHLNLMVPGADLAIVTEPRTSTVPVDAAATVRQAFRRARRRLQEYAQRKAGRPHGRL